MIAKSHLSHGAALALIAGAALLSGCGPDPAPVSQTTTTTEETTTQANAPTPIGPTHGIVHDHNANTAVSAAVI